MTWADESASFSDVFADELRLIIDGVDVTRFRGVPFQSNGYQLKKPLEFGAASFRFPSVSALELRSDPAERSSELQWLRKWAKARLVPVTDGTEGRAIWRGIVSLVHAVDGVVEVNCGGDAEGRLAWDIQPPPLFRNQADVGIWVTRAFQQSRIPITPRFGPDTGILLDNRGSFEDRLTYVLGLLADSQSLAGNTWTIRRTDADDMYEMVQVDRTTVHATLFAGALDGAIDLVDDGTEQPNTMYGAGISPNGSKWNGGVVPSLSPETPPDFPVVGSSFGLGTTDADTISGFGITSMNLKLWAEGRMSQPEATGVYDAETVDAVKQVQRRAKLSVTGVVNAATWNAIWDVSTTGLFSVQDAQILPIVQRDEVQQYLRTANGSIFDQNDDFDPSIPVVARFVSNGIMRKPRFVDWAEREMDRLDEKNWVGTITLNGQDLFAGSVTHEDVTTSPPTLLSRHALRPGMNVMLRDFDGDTLLHVSGINANPGEHVLFVDTQARDLRALGEILDRNRESRRNRGREWKQEHRASGATHDTSFGFFEGGGVLPWDVSVEANTWKVFPIPAGIEGTVSKIRLKVSTAAFACAVFGEKVTASWLHHHIGNPFDKDSDGNPTWLTTSQQNKLYNQRTLLYAAGTTEEPCGYWPKRHTNPTTNATTSAPVTGVHVDDGGFAFRCYGAPVVWVCVYALSDGVTQAGRVLWEQIEEGF